MLAAAAIALVPAAPASAGDFECTAATPVIRATVPGNVIVPKGEDCTIQESMVMGNVKLEQDASLFFDGSDAHGNIEADDFRGLDISGSTVLGDVVAKKGQNPVRPVVTLFDSDVPRGNVELQENEGDIDLYDNRIGEGLKVEKNKQGIAIVSNVIGSGPDGPVGGDLQFEENETTFYEISDNTVGGNLQVYKSSYVESGEVFGNTIRENLQCFDNVPPPEPGGPNEAAKKEGQCS